MIPVDGDGLSIVQVWNVNLASETNENDVFDLDFWLKCTLVMQHKSLERLMKLTSTILQTSWNHDEIIIFLVICQKPDHLALAHNLARSSDVF